MKKLLNQPVNEVISGFHRECFRLVDRKNIKGKQLLDVGCGFGWWEQHAIQNGVKRILAIDNSLDSKEVMKNINDKRLVFIVGDARQLPCKSASIDTVTSWEVLEHLPSGSEQQLFNEAYRVLKPNGQLFLSTQYLHPVSTMLDLAWWLVGHRHYTLSTIINYATNAGFKVEKIYKKGGAYSILNSLNVYFCKWILRREALFQDFFNRKIIEEFERGDGFFNIFLQCRKPAT